MQGKVRGGLWQLPNAKSLESKLSRSPAQGQPHEDAALLGQPPPCTRSGSRVPWLSHSGSG